MRRGPLSPEHRIAIGATHLGITKAEYRRHVEVGEKWCPGHRAWHPATLDIFYARATTVDRLDRSCKEIVRARSREGMRRLYARRRAKQQEAS